MPRRRGMGKLGRERIEQRWKELEEMGSQPSRAITGYTDEELEDIRRTVNAQYEEALSTTGVTSLPDLWPDKSNYYQGPTKSTRVSRHKYEPNDEGYSRTGAARGTVYVEFTNMRPNGNIRRTDVYKYKNVPLDVYESFMNSNSKGQFINRMTREFAYENLNKNSSVFD